MDCDSHPITDADIIKSIMDKTDDEIYFKDSKRRFIKVNKATARNLGLNTPNEAIGKSDFDFFSEEHAKKTFDEEKILKSTVPFIITVEKVTRHARANRYVATSRFLYLTVRKRSSAHSAY